MAFVDTAPPSFQAIAELKEDVYGHMLATRRDKYEGWIQGIKRYRRYAQIGEYAVPLGLSYFKDATTRIELIEALYIALRLVDDIVDGDAPLPTGWISATVYVEHLISFVRDPRHPSDRIEHLLAYGFQLGRALQMDLGRCMIDILGSLRFDATRRGTPKLYIPSKKELDRYFYRLDIRGTIGGCLIITRELRVTYRDLAPLGRATRIYYDIRDLAEDINAGLCNISREDVRCFGIRDVRDLTSPRLLDWRLARAEDGLLLLREWQKKKTGLRLHSFTRLALYRGYEVPAERYLEQVLQID